MKTLFRVFLLGLFMIPTFSTIAQDDTLEIVASYSILADVVSNVAGDAANVTSTMPAGADPHSFEPVPSDLVALAQADVVFINGAFFEEGLMEAIENADEDMNLVTASVCVEMIALGGGSHDHEGDDHDHEGDDHDHEEGEDHDHEEGEDHDHEGDDHDHEEGEDHDHEGDDHDHEGDDHDHEGDDHDHEGDDHDHEGEESVMIDSDIAATCEAHIAEMEAMHAEGDDHDHEEGEEHAEGDDHDHDHGGSAESLGRLYASAECAEGHGHDHGGESEEEEHSEDEHAHDHGSCDPHVWMDPHNVMYWTMLIRDTLIELDADNADIYTANADAYLTSLDTLMHDFIIPTMETVPEENRVLVTNHDSFGYLANLFDFEVAITVIPGGSTLAEPSAADIANVIELVNEEGVPALFGETTVSDDIIQQIADETGAAFFVLYSGTLSDADGPASTYLDYMRYNVTTIVEALGGSVE